MLSKTTKYAIKAILYIAAHTSETELIGLNSLSEKTKISKDTLAKVLQKLAKRDLIESKKGRNGGYYMTSKQKNTELMHIINKMEFSMDLFSSCLLGQDSCQESDLCPFHKTVLTIRTELALLYSSNTILETALKLP